MSGDLFPPMEQLSDFENVAKRNPLLCYLCSEQFEDPRILPCFHSFCSRCLRGRVAEGKVLCPLCGATAQLKEDQSLPPSDSLLKFLIESSTEEKALCANCDTAHGHMFFCNTCAQPLCGCCREETHKARMFSSHEIVLMSKRTKDIHKLCKLHDEPYIMFSTEKKVMLCINCFRDMKVESRSHCVDLETAYKQGCKKLDRAVQALHDLQNSVRDGILLLRVLLDEVRRNAVTEKQAIQTLCDNIQERVMERKTQLEEEVERQYKAKESLFKAQLVTLTTMLPTIHVNLVTSAAFTGTANKHEFLDLAYSLMARLTSIVQHQQLFPNQSSLINSDYKAQIAKCLEPLLFPYYGKGDNCPSSLPLSRPTTSQPVPMPNIRLELPVTAPSTSNGPSGGVTVVSYGPNGGRRGNNNGSKVKFIDAKGVFAEHCVEFDNSHRDLLQKLEKLKSQVQELHRDLTLRRTLAKNCKVSEFKGQVSEVDEQLMQHCDYLDQKRITLEKHWEESLQRIGNEQELYQAQMSDVLRLKQECQHLKTIVTQLSPFVESISKVTERIVPKLGDCSSSSRENQIHALFEQINTMQPDSQQRVDAIKSAEEEREMLSANRTNPMDEELIKTKGLLKAPVTRRESGSKRDLKDYLKDCHESRKEPGPPKNQEQASDSGKTSQKKRASVVLNVNGVEPPNEPKQSNNDTKTGDSITLKANADHKSAVDSVILNAIGGQTPNDQELSDNKDSNTGDSSILNAREDLKSSLESVIVKPQRDALSPVVDASADLGCAAFVRKTVDSRIQNGSDGHHRPLPELCVNETGDCKTTVSLTVNGHDEMPSTYTCSKSHNTNCGMDLVKPNGSCSCSGDHSRTRRCLLREPQKAPILPGKTQPCDKSCEVFTNNETYSSKMPKLISDQQPSELSTSAKDCKTFELTKMSVSAHSAILNGDKVDFDQT